jgi:hypothetical protein
MGISFHDLTLAAFPSALGTRSRPGHERSAFSADVTPRLSFLHLPVSELQDINGYEYLDLTYRVRWLESRELSPEKRCQHSHSENALRLSRQVRMFSSQVLEVAAGLIFIYLTMSTVCSGIKEIIARAFDTRATTLESAIRNMLADPNSAMTSKLLQNHLIAGTVQPGNKPSYISSRSFALALFDLIAPANPVQPRTVQDLKDGIANLPEPRLRSALLSLLDSAQQDVDIARRRVENWYDETMERVSGAYKRKSQAYIAGLSLALCAALNVDSLMIVRELWNDEALRTTVVQQAQNRATEDRAKGKCADSLSCATDSIRAVSVPPIGWAGEGFRALPQSLGWLWKVLGIFISGVAVAMGAPFWFDLLNKIVNLRLTGNPPPDSRQPAVN